MEVGCFPKTSSDALEKKSFWVLKTEFTKFHILIKTK